ncbi:hypothetical protein DPEC_G00244580 [Dallia pectoralis]|uniref:Uncharacterized protein n=1 Tax=Dallia pectoralis TaxID=75939 RepID=A0ACC2FVI4_DALPE|nr:hypothetical protein DPEC_G00244580 [Dallia pectoralis]
MLAPQCGSEQPSERTAVRENAEEKILGSRDDLSGRDADGETEQRRKKEEQTQHAANMREPYTCWRARRLCLLGRARQCLSVRPWVSFKSQPAGSQKQGAEESDYLFLSPGLLLSWVAPTHVSVYNTAPEGRPQWGGPREEAPERDYVEPAGGPFSQATVMSCTIMHCVSGYWRQIRTGGRPLLLLESDRACGIWFRSCSNVPDSSLSQLSRFRVGLAQKPSNGFPLQEQAWLPYM